MPLRQIGRQYNSFQSSALTNKRLAKAADYTLVNADKRKTIALGGAAYFTLTVGAASGFDADFQCTILNEDAGRAKAIVVNGLTTFFLWPGQSVTLYCNNQTQWQVKDYAPRWKLTGNVTFNVSATGSDTTTDGLGTGAAAFATIQKALSTIVGSLDLAGFTATVSIGTGTFTVGGSLSAPAIGGLISIVGNGAANTIISVTSNNCFVVSCPTALTLSAMKLATTTGGQCLYTAGAGAKIIVGAGMDLGACAGAHFYAEAKGEISVGSNYTISGSAAYHLEAILGGTIQLGNITVTLTGTPAWSTAGILFDTTGVISIFNVTYSGAATGKRYTGTMNAALQSYGAGSASTYFPGNSNGTTATGAQQA